MEKICLECEFREPFPSNWSRPVCAFVNEKYPGRFSQDNWNCALINNLRNLVNDIYGMSKDQRIYTHWQNDQNVCLISVSDIDLSKRAESLWMTWYKSRGRTEAIVMLGDEGIWYPYADDIRKVVAFYSKPDSTIQEQ